MKKTYIQPEVNTIVVSTMGMLAVSGTSISNTDATGNALGHEDDNDW